MRDARPAPVPEGWVASSPAVSPGGASPSPGGAARGLPQINPPVACTAGERVVVTWFAVTRSPGLAIFGYVTYIRVLAVP